MTNELIRTLAAHALNNLRVLNQMAAELLAAAAERNLPRIDEALFLELFSPHLKNQTPSFSVASHLSIAVATLSRKAGAES